MDRESIEKKIRENRKILKGYTEEFEVDTDQELKLKQPPLVKPASGGGVTKLTRDFDSVITRPDYLTLLKERKSRRAYKEKPLQLDTLAFLLWSTQGVKSIKGDKYATLRPVASGGARHAFETYLAVLNVQGLQRGIYRYLPLEHAIEFISEEPDGFESAVAASLCDQKWAAAAGAVFYYSVIPYRAEWRYSYLAHRILLMDAGHVMQNLYLSCEAAGCGTCAIAAFEQELSDRLIGLDGEEEHIIYVAPVGVV